MNILFTGASSFTGMWFAKELSSQGHAVTCIFQKSQNTYQELRGKRVAAVLTRCISHFNCKFGSDSFLELVKSSRWDLLCHHAAEVSCYKSSDFDVSNAVKKNTWRLEKVLQSLKERGCCRIMLTGSVFEQNEGEGDNIEQAVSPYGYSKGLTSEIFRFACEQNKIQLGKFVIPNPFGPYEEQKFTTYLAKSWLSRKIPEVSFPNYVRDNIHVSLLAKLYAKAAASIDRNTSYQQWNPSGYSESQAKFTERFAKEMEKRLSIPCAFTLKEQTEFPEPKKRINTQPINIETWSEKEAWDQLASFYSHYYG